MEVQGSVHYIPNNYFYVFDVTNVKHKEIGFEGNMLVKLHLKVFHLRVLFAMSIILKFAIMTTDRFIIKI